MSTHSETGKPYVDATAAQSPASDNPTLTPGDIEMDARIAACIASREETIEQAESLLIRSNAVLAERGLDQRWVMSQLSPEELAKVNEMNAQDEAEMHDAVAREQAAQAFATAEKKDSLGGAGPLRRPRSFI
ncbi:hypothetical protein [Robbsia sp. KACC 23696]|uniref:hypothetical protein n=1 Tax=Robbsia sp. KACC 23696 TaxID=3149231 RepID=UPI00325BE183